MKYDKPLCPECGERTNGTLEVVQGRAELSYFPDTDSFEYGGYTDIFWDEQRSVELESGTFELLCHNGHQWTAREINEDLDRDLAPNTAEPGRSAAGVDLE